MVSLLFAAKAIGMAQFNADASTADYAPKVWEVVSMDYPVFKWNTPIDLGEGCSDENHVGPSYDFCLRRVSSLSGKSLLEFDANGDLRLEYPFTLREAVLSVARLYESDPNVVQELLKSAPRYVLLNEAAENTISQEHLTAAEARPTFENLPTTHAMVLNPISFQNLFATSLIQKDMVDMIADTGAFNAIHIGFECEFYYSDQDGTIDLAYLENLDRVIEWCIDRKLHIIWDFATIPGYAGGGENGDILTNPEHYRQAVELMELFSARYANVPSGVFSFYILGESDNNYFSEEELVTLTNDLTADLRKSSPGRGVLSNIWMSDKFGAFLSGWCEGLSETETTVLEFYHRDGEPKTSWRYVTGQYQAVNIPCNSAWKGVPLALPVITVHEDGSYDISQAESYVQTPESIRAYVETWTQWGKQTNTPVWVSESGYPMSQPTEDRVAYMRCYAEILDEYDIGWTLYTDFESNWGPIVHKNALEDHVSELPNSGYVGCGDFYLDEPVLEILREYLPD